MTIPMIGSLLLLMGAPVEPVDAALVPSQLGPAPAAARMIWMDPAEQVTPAEEADRANPPFRKPATERMGISRAMTADEVPISVLPQAPGSAIAPPSAAGGSGTPQPPAAEQTAEIAAPEPVPTAIPSPSPQDSPTGVSPAGDDPTEIVVTGRSGSTPGDPFERINAASFELTEQVDKAVVGPVARAYKKVTPKPVRQGLRNFLNNLREPVVFVNFLLQLKIGKAAETVGRFAINSTMGMGGMIDVAKRCPFNLPWRPNGFSDTLGVYGVKEGPFIFVPLIGPTTVRDLVGGAVDRVASPIALGGPFKSRPYVVGSNVYRVLDHRAEMEDELQAVRESDDPYSARRDGFLEKRRSRVERLRDGDAVTGDPGTVTQPADASSDNGKQRRCRSAGQTTPAEGGNSPPKDDVDR